MTATREMMVERMLRSDKTADGDFIVGVRTTKIYCLPSCRPPRKPKPENVTFYRTIAEARDARLRVCKLCKPDQFYAAEQEDTTVKIAYLDTIDEVPGPLAFATDADGALLRLHFLDGNYARTIEDDLVRDGYALHRDLRRTAAAREQIADYCTGNTESCAIVLIRWAATSGSGSRPGSRRAGRAIRGSGGRWPPPGRGGRRGRGSPAPR